MTGPKFPYLEASSAWERSLAAGRKKSRKSLAGIPEPGPPKVKQKKLDKGTRKERKVSTNPFSETFFGHFRHCKRQNVGQPDENSQKIGKQFARR